MMIMFIGWERANSEEFDKLTPHPVVVFMPEINQSEMGKKHDSEFGSKNG